MPILSAKDARTFMSSLVFGAMPHGQCKCAWISTSYVVGVQSGGNTITEWARFAAPVVTGLMSKGGQQHLRLLVQLLTDMRRLSRLLSATFIGTSSRDLLTFALGVGVWTQATFECNLLLTADTFREITCLHDAWSFPCSRKRGLWLDKSLR